MLLSQKVLYLLNREPIKTHLINNIMKRFVLFLAGLTISMSVMFSQGQLQQLPNDPAVKVGKLENGLTYYLRHNDKPAGRAEFYLATNVGAIQETPDQDGLAHFLEHMCFNGTKNFPDKTLLDYLQSIGASFGGNVNASTGVEHTVYMLNNIPLVRESVIDTCILIMHDYSHFVTNSPAEIDKERGVIIEERRARRNAGWRMHEKTLPYYYGDSKYGNCTLIGSQENLENFKPESLHNFYKTWYRPDMQALIIVGDIDIDKTEQKIRNIFADIPMAENPKAKDVIKIKDNQEPIIGIITDPEATSTTLEILWKSEAAPKEINSTIQGKLQDLIKNIIGNVMNERLSEISAKPEPPFLSAYFGIGNICETVEVVMGNVGCREGDAIPSFKAFYTEIEKMRRFGFSNDEVQRAKDDLISMFESAAKKADTRKNEELVQELLDNFFDNEAYMEPKSELELMEQVMPMINSQIINQICSQIITDSNMVVIFKAPEKASGRPSEADFKNAIEEVRNSEIKANEEEVIAKDFLDADKLKGSKIKKSYTGIYNSKVYELKNGLKVIMYPSDTEKDKISIDLYKKGGQSLIPTSDMDSFDKNIYGLFMKNCGVSKFSSTTTSKMLSGKNIWVSPYINRLRHGVSGSSSVKDFETMMQLAYLYFADPRFDENEYNQGINTINAILPNLEQQPNFKFQKEMYATLYGNNPRRKTLSKETVENANLATIEKNYRMLFNDAAGATMIIAGDFKPEEILPIVQKYAGSIKKGKKSLDWIDTNEDIVGGKVLNDFKENMQTPMTTVIDVYSAPMKYSFDKDVALEAATYILNMRYVTTMREDEGGTYGAQTFSSLDIEPKQRAVLNIYYNSKPSSADKLRQLAVEGLQGLAENGPTAEEFEMAKKNLEKNIPENRIKNSYWANAIKDYELYGFDSDKAREAAINALTPEAIKNVVSEILAAGNMVEVIMRPDVSAEKE